MPITELDPVDVIPPSGKVIGTPELQNMVEASLDGWLTTGRFNSQFEAKLADYLGVKHVLSVNSGSSKSGCFFCINTFIVRQSCYKEAAMRLLLWLQVFQRL